jgi:hypothetical protein
VILGFLIDGVLGDDDAVHGNVGHGGRLPKAQAVRLRVRTT